MCTHFFIVVAIVGVLVAISIPIFSGKLVKAKIATNQANYRSAKAAAVAEYITNGETKTKYYEYHVGSGKVTDDTDDRWLPAEFGATKTDFEDEGIKIDGPLESFIIEITEKGEIDIRNSYEYISDPKNYE